MKNILFYVIAFAFSANLYAQVLTEEQLKFPGYYKFRGELNNADHSSYENWIASHDGNVGMIKKFICEEHNLKPNEDSLSAWIKRSEIEYPELIKLMHWNGRGRRLVGVEKTAVGSPHPTELYFPGHWAYRPGAMLTQSCTAWQTTITVSNASLFSATRYSNYFGDYIILVKLDNAGNKLWYEAEMAKVLQVDKVNKQLTLQRAIAYDNMSFDAGKTYVAPVQAIKIVDLEVFYNHSSACPRDINGRTAADVNVKELSDQLLGGRLAGVDGIAFDVCEYEQGGNADLNNDFIGDGGWVDGVNIQMEGYHQYLKDLRAALGDNFILTGDGHHPQSQRAIGIFNGMESEGLVQWNDAWRGISRTINAHQYWLSQNEEAGVFPFGYSTMKTKYPTDDANKVRLRRYGVGVTTCLGIYATGDAESFDESLTSYPWLVNGALGYPTSDLIRYAKFSPNVISFTHEQLSNLMVSDNCDVTQENGEIKVVTHPGYTAQDRMTVKLPAIQFPAGDVTIFVEAQSFDPLEGMTIADRVPRDMELHITGLPDYGEGSKNSAYEEIYGFMGTHIMEEMSFYYRRPGVGAGPQDITISVQGRGAFKIKSIKIYNEADILIRSFDNGVSIANPALDDREVDLSRVYPGQLSQTITVPSVDASFLQEPGITDTPRLNVNLSTDACNEVDATVVTITANASRPVIGDQTVDIDISGDVTLSNDYTLSGTQITIADGQTSGTATLTVVDDSDYELTETATVALINPSSGVFMGDTTSAELVIIDDESTSIELTLSANAGSEANATQITLTATASKAVTGAQTVDIDVSGNVTLSDYTLSATQIPIADGQTTGTATFSIVDDIDIENEESATIAISNPSTSIVLGRFTSSNIVITDNDVPLPVELSLSTYTASEAAATEITIAATVSEAVIGDQTVDIVIGGNVNLGDYILSANQITIADGETTGTATMTIFDDKTIENVEYATVTLSNPSERLVLGSTTSANIGITNDDIPALVEFSLSANAGSEADATEITLTVTAEHPVPGDQTVDINVAGYLTAEDYTLSANQITILDGETIGTVVFTVVADDNPEEAETGIISISNPSQGLILGGTTDSYITVSADDVTAIKALPEIDEPRISYQTVSSHFIHFTSEIISYEIYNTTGQLVKSKTGNGIVKVDISDLVNGVYFIVIDEKNYEKFIKQ